MSITILNIKKHIPKHCFESNLLLSLLYMIIDISILSTAFISYEYIKNNYSLIGLFLYFIYWNVYGLFAWCLFVIGHDCGHGSFSIYPIINSICGHICHSVLMVPFYPWARSHYFHHRYHNHKEKDKSHPWVTKEEFENLILPMKYILPSLFGPFVAFWVYLIVGTKKDGSHFIWFGKLYESTSNTEKFKSFISSLSVIIWIYLVYIYTESILNWCMMYGGIIMFCYFWLYMVTWFQHHSEITLVYNDKTWSYLKGAFQTVDHKIGYNIDNIHHNISDCHIIHHMFFTEIPHYHLKEATYHLYEYLKSENKEYLIKKKDHSLFPLKYIYDFFKLYFKIGLTKWIYID